jgi:hypothetical protein
MIFMSFHIIYNTHRDFSLTGASGCPIGASSCGGRVPPNEAVVVTYFRGDSSGQFVGTVGRCAASGATWVGPAAKPKEGLEARREVAI